MLPAGGRQHRGYIILQAVTQSSAPEDGQNNFSKHVELTGIINKPLLLHLVGCLYYLYQWCTVKQISDNEIYLLIKYINSVLRRVAKRLYYIEDVRCLKVKMLYFSFIKNFTGPTCKLFALVQLLLSISVLCPYSCDSLCHKGKVCPCTGTEALHRPYGP